MVKNTIKSIHQSIKKFQNSDRRASREVGVHRYLTQTQKLEKVIDRECYYLITLKYYEKKKMDLKLIFNVYLLRDTQCL